METELQTRLIPWLDFIEELNSLLQSSGISPSRLPVLAEFQQKTDRQNPETNESRQQVGKVILYMEEHLADELSLEHLAEEIGLSKYQLIRRFRDEEGTTPWKFLTQKRIEKVKNLLAEGLSPTQAALEAGFYDQSHLNKVFGEEIGITPKEYQEQNFRNKN